MENTTMTTIANRNIARQLVNELREPVNSFLGDCYTNEVRIIDEATDLTTEQKLDARRKTNLIYGLLSLFQRMGFALLNTGA